MTDKVMETKGRRLGRPIQFDWRRIGRSGSSLSWAIRLCRVLWTAA
jgi:hypothetical protein